MLTTTQDVVNRIDKKTLVQTFKDEKVVKDEIRKNVFKKEIKTIRNFVTIEDINEITKAIPYVGKGTKGISLGGGSDSIDKIEAPVMKALLRIKDTEFAYILNLKDKDYKAFMREKVIKTKKDMNKNIEWFVRHVLTNGSISYKYLIGKTWTTFDVDLGTCPDEASPTTLLDDSSVGIVGISMYLEQMFDNGADNNNGYFKEPEDVIVYTPKDVWNVFYGKLDGHKTNDIVPGRQLNQNDLLMGSFICRKFEGARTDPETQATVNSVTAKQLRMVDTKNSQHTLALTKLDNLKATGASEHIWLETKVDDDGEFVDLLLNYRPLALFDTNGMVTSQNVIS